MYLKSGISDVLSSFVFSHVFLRAGAFYRSLIFASEFSPSLFLVTRTFVLWEVDYYTSLWMCGSNGCYECVEILTLVTSGELCSSVTFSTEVLFLSLLELLLLPALWEIA